MLNTLVSQLMKKVIPVSPHYADLLSHRYIRPWLHSLTTQLSVFPLYFLPSFHNEATAVLIPSHGLKPSPLLSPSCSLLLFEWWTGSLDCYGRQPDRSKVAEQNNPFMKPSFSTEVSWREEGQCVGSVPPQHQPEIVLLYSLPYLEQHTAGLSPQNWLCSMNAARERSQMNVWMGLECECLLPVSLCLPLVSLYPLSLVSLFLPLLLLSQSILLHTLWVYWPGIESVSCLRSVFLRRPEWGASLAERDHALSFRSAQDQTCSTVTLFPDEKSKNQSRKHSTCPEANQHISNCWFYTKWRKDVKRKIAVGSKLLLTM